MLSLFIKIKIYGYSLLKFNTLVLRRSLKNAKDFENKFKKRAAGNVDQNVFQRQEKVETIFCVTGNAALQQF